MKTALKANFILTVLGLFIVSTGRSEVTIIQTETPEKKVVFFDGAIDAASAEKVMKRFNEAAKEARKIILRLNSPGGQLSDTEDLIKFLQRSKKRVTLLTLVENGDECNSACILLFMQGERRWAGKASAFMFHGARRWFTNVPNEEMTQYYLKLLIDAGADSSFFDNLEKQHQVFSKPGRYWASGFELFERSGIVTDLRTSYIKEEPFYEPFDPQIRPR